mgnify:CR=1 FL=1
MQKFFNFNNEEYVLPFELHEDGTVTIEVNGTNMDFASVRELAENYALARNVNTQHLKNWTLVEDGDNYAFVLRAATAGVDFFDLVESGAAPARFHEPVDDYEYEQEFNDEFVFDTLTSDEIETAGYILGTNDPGVIAASVEDEDVLARVQDAHELITRVGRGNFRFGMDVIYTLDQIHSGELPTQEVEKANRQLVVAAIARRTHFQILEVNVATGGTEDIQRAVNEPFRDTELVTEIDGHYVLFVK